MPLPRDYSLLIDGRLDPVAAAKLEAKLAKNAGMASEYGLVRDARDTAREIGQDQVELPEGFDDRLRQRIAQADLQIASEDKARRSVPGYWWHRVAAACGGIAAGVAIALGAFNILGMGEPAAVPHNAAGVVSPGGIVVVGAKPENTVKMRDVLPMADRKLRAYGDLRTLANARTVIDPAWLEAELAGSGLSGESDGLLALLEKVDGAEGEQYAMFVATLERAVALLAYRAKEARSQNKHLPAGDVVEVLGQVVVLGGPAKRAVSLASGNTQRASNTPLPGATKEFESYTRARRMLADRDYTGAAEAFIVFMATFADSTAWCDAAYYAAQALRNSGDAAGALRLVDVASRIRPELLKLYGAGDLRTLEQESTAARWEWRIVSDANGSSRLHLYKREMPAQPSTSGLDSLLDALTPGARRPADGTTDLDLNALRARWKQQNGESSAESSREAPGKSPADGR